MVACDWQIFILWVTTVNLTVVTQKMCVNHSVNVQYCNVSPRSVIVRQYRPAISGDPVLWDTCLFEMRLSTQLTESFFKLHSFSCILTISVYLYCNIVLALCLKSANYELNDDYDEKTRRVSKFSFRNKEHQENLNVFLELACRAYC